jgi:hypothetical protein
MLVSGNVRRNGVVILDNLYLVTLRNLPGLPFRHLWDELQLVLRLHYQLLHLPTLDLLLNVLPILFLLADLKPKTNISSSISIPPEFRIMHAVNWH